MSNIEGEGFMAYSAASHQGAIKLSWLQYSPDKSKTVCVSACVRV